MAAPFTSLPDAAAPYNKSGTKVVMQRGENRRCFICFSLLLTRNRGQKPISHERWRRSVRKFLLESYIHCADNATPRCHFVGEHAVEIFRRASRRVVALGKEGRTGLRLLENRVQMSVQQVDDRARRFRRYGDTGEGADADPCDAGL